MSSVIDDISSKDNKIVITNQLIRSLIVYKLCSFQWLVNRAPSLIRFAEKVHLSTPVYWIIKKTFFAQFCGYVCMILSFIKMLALIKIMRIVLF